MPRSRVETGLPQRDPSKAKSPRHRPGEAPARRGRTEAQAQGRRRRCRRQARSRLGDSRAPRERHARRAHPRTQRAPGILAPADKRAPQREAQRDETSARPTPHASLNFRRRSHPRGNTGSRRAAVAVRTRSNGSVDCPLLSDAPKKGAGEALHVPYARRRVGRLWVRRSGPETALRCAVRLPRRGAAQVRRGGSSAPHPVRRRASTASQIWLATSMPSKRSSS